eukprot:7384546-Prymnesium_polylepis.3
MPPGASACLHSVTHRIFLFGVRHEKPPLRTNRPPIESMTVSPGVAWAHKYPWIQVQYMFFCCMCNTGVSAIHKYPLYPYPQYFAFASM